MELSINQQTAPIAQADARLLAAALQGDIVSLRTALTDGASPNARQPIMKDGWTALSCVVLSGKEEAVQLLLAAGAAVNAQCPDGTTALHKACLWGHVRIVELLLAHGADQMIQDQDGWTAQQLASAQANTQLLQLLAAANRPPPTSNEDT
jgi:ankyrin repeat protein